MSDRGQKRKTPDEKEEEQEKPQEKRAKAEPKFIFSDEYIKAVLKINTEYKKIDPKTCTFSEVLDAKEVDAFIRKWRGDNEARDLPYTRQPYNVNGLTTYPRVCDDHVYHMPPCASAPKPKARAPTIAKHEANKARLEQFKAERAALDDKRKAAAKAWNDQQLFDWFQRERDKIEAALALDPPRMK